MTGLILFLLMVAIEFILLFIQIKNDNSPYMIKRTFRFSILLILIILTLFNVFEWGFRYYLLLFIYFSILLVNELSYYKSKQKTNTLNKSQLFRRFLSLVLIIGFSFIPSLMFPKYMPLGTTGIYEVQVSKEILIDETRIETFNTNNEFRQIGIHSWSPKNTNNTFPIIIYSHGGISLPSSNESLFLELASHGYIVFSVAHPYHSIKTALDKGNNVWIDRQYMSELNKEDASENPEQSYDFYQKWMKLRTDDLNFVLDQIIINSNNSTQNSIYNQIDIENIGIVGHSLGGSAALCMGRERNDIKAVIALESPFMCDIIGVTDQGFTFDETPYPTPVLNIYSDSAFDYLSIWPQYRKNHDLLSSINESSYHEHIIGSGHFSLTDLSLTSPILTRFLNGTSFDTDEREILKQVNLLSLNFFNKHLKNGL